MKTYQFKSAFIRYVLILTTMMVLLYGSLILIYNHQVDTEMKETALHNLSVLQTTLKQQTNPHMLYVQVDGKQIHNHTHLTNEPVKVMIRHVHASKPYKYEGKEGIYYINQAQYKGTTLYGFTDVSDYEETKDLLYNLMILLMLFTTVLIIGGAYYLAIKPIKAYEAMLKVHQDFIQNTTHEMKTPIASMSLGLDYIKALEPNLNDKSMQSIQKMKYEIQYIESLIQKTLNISEDASQIHDIVPEINHTIDQIEQLHHVHIIKMLPTTLLTHVASYDVKQMLTILLDNAIKHNDTDIEIKVIANIEQQHLKLTVVDNGIGISTEQLTHIFNRYYRGNTNTVGSGLGLDILNQLVKKYNGKIDVQSIKNIKTQFTILL